MLANSAMTSNCHACCRHDPSRCGHPTPVRLDRTPAIAAAHSDDHSRVEPAGRLEQLRRSLQARRGQSDSKLLYALASNGRGESGESTIQQFMMRLSSNLRRFRWAVFAAWLLLLVPAVYLAMNQSGHLTGGGFEVEGSQSLYVQRQLEDALPGSGRLPARVGRRAARRTRPSPT